MGWVVFALSATYRRHVLAHAALAGVSRRDALSAVTQAGKMVAELPRLWLGKAVPVRMVGSEHIDAAMSAGHGILFLTPHMGCFEITASAYAARYGTIPGKNMTVLFRPPRQPWLREVVASARQRPGLDTAPTTLAGVKQLVKTLRGGDDVGGQAAVDQCVIGKGWPDIKHQPQLLRRCGLSQQEQSDQSKGSMQTRHA